MTDILKRHRVYSDKVELPNGATVTVAQAVAAGHVVEGTPAAAALAEAEARSALIDGFTALPEARGKAAAAIALAVSNPGMSLDLAARMLAGAPLDPVATDAPAVSAPMVVDPRAARLAEIKAAGAAVATARGLRA